MSGLDFLDTNVLVYAYDLSEVAKRNIAQDLLRRALNGDVVVST
jgi:predicted nucleic acid-binding protein